MYGEEKYNIEYADFLLRMISDEINRARDWPLKILTFTSALHFGVLVSIISSKIIFTCFAKSAITILFSVLMVWTIYYFYKCHTNYLKLRNSQIELQDQIGLSEMGVIPKEWLIKNKISPLTAVWGWGYYAFIAISFWLATIGVLWFEITINTKA